MEIFGIGLGELLIIALVALLILGPERMPQAARSLGKGIADLRRAAEPARAAWTDLSNEITSVTAPIATGNPWSVHPILQKMTPEERQAYIAGGDMPPAAVEELERAAQASAAHQPIVEDSELDYPAPHAPVRRPVSSETTMELEDVFYPPPGWKTGAPQL